MSQIIIKENEVWVQEPESEWYWGTVEEYNTRKETSKPPVEQEVDNLRQQIADIQKVLNQVVLGGI